MPITMGEEIAYAYRVSPDWRFPATYVSINHADIHNPGFLRVVLKKETGEVNYFGYIASFVCNEIPGTERIVPIQKGTILFENDEITIKIGG